jgi:hypothetical protein
VTLLAPAISTAIYLWWPRLARRAALGRDAEGPRRLVVGDLVGTMPDGGRQPGGVVMHTGVRARRTKKGMELGLWCGHEKNGQSRSATAQACRRPHGVPRADAREGSVQRSPGGEARVQQRRPPGRSTGSARPVTMVLSLARTAGRAASSPLAPTGPQAPPSSEGGFYFLPHFTWDLYDLALFTLESIFCPYLLGAFMICPFSINLNYFILFPG